MMYMRVMFSSRSKGVITRTEIVELPEGIKNKGLSSEQITFCDEKAKSLCKKDEMVLRWKLLEEYELDIEEEVNMNKPVTVNQLLKNLEGLKQRGYGEALIFITDDEECNGYHAMWYVGEAAGEMPADRKKSCEEINYDLRCLKDKKMAVYVG